MDPITMALIFGGVGAAKGALIDKPAQQLKDRTNAEKERYAYLTGFQSPGNQPVNAADTALSAAGSGAMFGLLNQKINGGARAPAAEAGTVAPGDALSAQVASAGVPLSPAPAGPMDPSKYSSWKLFGPTWGGN